MTATIETTITRTRLEITKILKLTICLLQQLLAAQITALLLQNR
jgi:hypothetical protein